MKISKKTGRIKMDADEVRVGNFFVERDGNYMKIQDLHGVFWFRASRRVPIGIWLENIWARANYGDESAITTLKTYIATMWSVYSVAPDDEFIKDAIQIANDALQRHPDWYGVKNDSTDEEDAAATQEVKEMKEFEEEIRNMPE